MTRRAKFTDFIPMQQELIAVKAEIETLRARIVELEAHKDAGWDQQRYWCERYESLTARFHEAEAALTEARSRLAAADRMAEALGWFLFRHSNPMSGTKELDEYLSLKETGQ